MKITLWCVSYNSVSLGVKQIRASKGILFQVYINERYMMQPWSLEWMISKLSYMNVISNRHTIRPKFELLYLHNNGQIPSPEIHIYPNKTLRFYSLDTHSFKNAKKRITVMLSHCLIYNPPMVSMKVLGFSLLLIWHLGLSVCFL